ncbi:SDR family oxidoreductase [uncultured Bacteroides sp.]|uniref:SDR family NAD(P)-dependent oxidoreductase n=1 Tax=uncultured Bacteroides sp. TaxID=162156 RepID=UPI002AAC401F|nr:SDR family oxidoreductase [uncultured Bacteroides sp.]
MDRVIIITGSRKGLGYSLCNYFLNEGDFVYGCSRRASAITHDNYVHFRLDVSDEAAVTGMVKDIYKNKKRIDVLINNAGVASMNHSLLTPCSTVKRIMETNFTGTFLMCREVARYMIKHKNGRIINYSTVAVPLHLSGELVYSSSKAAVEQLTRVLAAEIGEWGVTVNAVGPTPISTDLIKNIPEDKIKALIQRQSIKRMGIFNDVLNVVKFFLSRESDFITGQVIYLGGIS